MENDGYAALREKIVSLLLAAADAHENGHYDVIDAGFEDFEADVPSDIASGHPIMTALRFWDSWIDARNHGWSYYDRVTEARWPLLAREIAEDLRTESVIKSDLVLSEFVAAHEHNVGHVPVPVSGCVRAASAAVGTVIGIVGLGDLAFGSRRYGLAAFFLAWGAFMWLPMFARPRRTRTVAAAHARRTGVATLLLFVAGSIASGVANLLERGYMRTQHAAIVAIHARHIAGALGLVTVIFLFVFAYYTTQATFRSRDDNNSNRGGA